MAGVVDLCAEEVVVVDALATVDAVCEEFTTTMLVVGVDVCCPLLVSGPTDVKLPNVAFDVVPVVADVVAVFDESVETLLVCIPLGSDISLFLH